MVRLSLFTLLAAALPVILGHPQPNLLGRDIQQRCGTHNTPEISALAGAASAQDNIDQASASPASRTTSPFTWPIPTKWIFVPVYFHVIAAGRNLSDGWVPDSQLKAQYDVMNADYAPHKIRFVFLGTTRTINPAWADNTNGTVNELEFKTALRRGNYKTLNVYFVKRLFEYYTGYATFPKNVTAGSTEFLIDGVIIDYSTVPGGMTHEVGHWFQLFHPFEGSDCIGPGDYVADTPQTKDYHFGCQIGADSCPDQPGTDPVTNYMEYSDDDCYTNFTPGQTKRMHTAWYQYRDVRLRWEWIWW